MASIRLELDRIEASAGGRLAGVVNLMPDANLPVRSVRVRLYGYEQALSKEAPAKLARWIQPPKPGRASAKLACIETTLTGRETFKSKREEIADTWGFLLGRRRYPILQCGEYTYPFVIHIPGNLLPTYFGQYYEVRYFLTAYADVPLAFKKTGPMISEEIIILGAALEGGQSIAECTSQDACLSINVASDAVEPNMSFMVHYEIRNPSNRKIRGIDAVLLQKETSGRRSNVKKLASASSDFRNNSDSCYEGEMTIHVPADAASSFEGRYGCLAHSLEVRPRAEWWDSVAELMIEIGRLR